VKADRRTDGKTGRSLLALVVLAGLIAAPAQGQYPTSPPAAAPLRPMQFPPFQEVRLPNGLQLLVVENHELPVLSVSLALPAGSRYEPAGMEGLAGLVAELITKGTRTRTADQIAERIEGVGASLSAGADDDYFTIGTTVLTDHTELAFDLLSDVLLNSTFPESELELARTRTLSSLRLEQSQPGSVASRFFSQTLYGRHPYGRQATETSVKAITPVAVRSYASSRLRPGGGLLVLAGDVTLARARALATRFLGAWRGAAPVAAAPARPPAAKATEILLVHRPGSAQSNIVVGNLAQRPGDPLYYPFVVGNKILGGGADARLFLILREQKGWTYGAYSGMSRRRDLGYFSATTEVRTPVTDSALTELMRQLRRIRTEAVADSELTSAKGFLVGSFPLSIETPQQIAGQVTRVKLLGLGPEYLRTYRDRLAAVTALDIRRAARSTIRPDSSVIVVVGDGQAIYEKLRAIAPVRIVDVDGNALTAADLTPRGGPLPLDRALLTAHTDSFRIVFQGNPVGTLTSTIRLTPDSVVYGEVQSAMGALQTTVVAFSRTDLTVTQVKQSTQFGAQQTGLEATYRGGRMTSRGQRPQRGGAPQPFQLDTAVAEHHYDENALHVLLLALPLAAGKTFSIAVIDPTDASTSVLTAKVGGPDSVTVPAGTFRAFRVDLSGGQEPLTAYITGEGPRRIIKLEAVGQPVAFELVKGTP
jgi:zinc protease